MVEDYQTNDQLIQDQLGSTDGDAILDSLWKAPAAVIMPQLFTFCMTLLGSPTMADIKMKKVILAGNY